MATDWNEVGERFSALGRTLQGRWSSSRERDDARDEEAAGEVRSALDRVNAALDDLADAITNTVEDPEVHRAATSAAGGLIEALGASLDELAARIQQAGSRREDMAPGTDQDRQGPGGEQV
jgi:methyl-accepting chemotaxis protein